MKWGVVVFPGSNCDQDSFHVVKNVLQNEATYLWHKDRDLKGVDVIILPGGFSYGDYLRSGAMARFSPIMEEVIQFAKSGRPLVGICNGFQILVEAGLLPGALMRNRSLQFICKDVYVRAETTKGVWTSKLKNKKVLKMPIAHGDGQYFIKKEELKKIEDQDQIAFRYCSPEGKLDPSFNPNGSLDHIAGVYNEKKNILGLMPHPERASEEILGSTDGRFILESVL